MFHSLNPWNRRSNMSTITNTNVRPKGIYDFSMEMPTQKPDKKLLIEQSDQGLKISVQKKGKAFLIEKSMIDGLPKTDLVPMEFFSSCYAQVSDKDKVYLLGRVRGGMMEGQEGKEDNSIVLRNIPKESFEIQQFYKNQAIVDRVDVMKTSGSFTLGEVVEYIKTGAQAISVSYLCGKSLSCGVELTETKDEYSKLVTQTATGFVEIQKNNLLVIEAHISSSRHAALGSLKDAFTALKEGGEFAQENIVICSDLLLTAQSIRNRLTECKKSLACDDKEIVELRNKISSTSDEIKATEGSIEILKKETIETVNEMKLECNKEIEAIKSKFGEQISELDKKELEAYQKEQEFQDQERKAKMKNALTLGLFSALGGRTEYDSSLESKKKIDAYESKRSMVQECSESVNKIEDSYRERINEKQKNYAELQYKLKELHLSKTNAVLELSRKLRVLCGSFSDEKIAQTAINMALIGLDEVTSGIEKYQGYMTEVKAQTEIATKKIEDLVKIGDNLIALKELSRTHKQIFCDEFTRSVYHWLALASFGEICSKHLG